MLFIPTLSFTVRILMAWRLGGFGAHPGHDAHILTTVSAVQILAIEGALDQVDKDKIASCESITVKLGKPSSVAARNSLQ